MSVATSTALAVAGGVAAVGTVAGGLIQAGAQGRAGEAELSAAQQQVVMQQKALEAQQAARADAVKLAGISPSEIQSINQFLTTKQSALTSTLDSIRKQQEALDAVDPNVKAAGSDLYSLLTGHASSVLAPLQTSLDRSRQQLVSRLSSQLGPGYATSSAGIQALTQFDEQSALTLQGAQQNAISNLTSTYSNLFGQQQQGQGAITSQTGEAYGRALLADSQVLQANQAVKAREVNAFTGSPVNFNAPAEAQGNVINASGQPFAGQASLGQTIAAGTSPISSAFGQIAGQQFISGLLKPGAAAPSAAPATQPANYGSLVVGNSDIGSRQLPGRAF